MKDLRGGELQKDLESIDKHYKKFPEENNQSPMPHTEPKEKDIFKIPKDGSEISSTGHSIVIGIAENGGVIQGNNEIRIGIADGSVDDFQIAHTLTESQFKKLEKVFEDQNNRLRTAVAREVFDTLVEWEEIMQKTRGRGLNKEDILTFAKDTYGLNDI